MMPTIHWGKGRRRGAQAPRPADALRQQVDAIFHQMLEVADAIESETKNQMEEHRRDDR